MRVGYSASEVDSLNQTHQSLRLPSQFVREVIVIRHALDEAGDEFDGLLHVAEVGHFHDGVHVAGAGRKSAL